MPDAVRARYSRSIPPRFPQSNSTISRCISCPRPTFCVSCKKVAGSRSGCWPARRGHCRKRSPKVCRKQSAAPCRKRRSGWAASIFPAPLRREVTYANAEQARNFASELESMSPNISLVRDGKKFMWDGRSYASLDEALHAAEAYRNDKFEICVAEEEGQFLVYTRRVVNAVVMMTQ